MPFRLLAAATMSIESESQLSVSDNGDTSGCRGGGIEEDDSFCAIEDERNIVVDRKG
jgi:hypothetical protein